MIKHNVRIRQVREISKVFLLFILALAFIFLPLTSAAKDFNLKNASDSLFFGVN